ncbi:MAG: hypothetical protein R3Y04_05465 [Rikenellaceae bacterium]
MENTTQKSKRVNSRSIPQKKEKVISTGEAGTVEKTQITNAANKEQLITNNFIEALRSFMNQNYGDYSDVDNLALFADVLQKLEDNHNECEALSNQNRVIAQSIASNPRLMILIKELVAGTPLRVALAKSDLTETQPDIDDEDYDAYNMAVALSRQRRNDAKEQAHHRIEKCEACGQVAQQFYQQVEAEPQEINEFVQFLNSMIDNIYNAEIDQDVINVLWKAFNYEREVRRAKEQGVIEGRNSIIETRKASHSDGLPSFSSAGNRQNSVVKEGYIERLMKQKFV